MIDERYILKPKTRSTFIGLSVIGLVLVIVGLFWQKFPVEHHGTTELAFAWTRFWANYLLSGFFFTVISVLAAAFICIQYLATGGWYTTMKRILEAMTSFLPIGAVFFIILIVASFAGHDHGMNALYEWMHEEEVAHDVVLQGKAPYLNFPFMAIRTVGIFALWILFARRLRSLSIQEDDQPGIHKYNASMKTAAIFLPIFGLSFCLFCFDWMMSIQPHWYSTIFAVNIFAAALVACLMVMNMTAHMMKKAGYMSFVNENHYHDASKFIFGFSIFWTYTWLSQYLLIWYANLPEETPYYFARLHGGWKTVFFLNLALNFVAPFLLFMTRNAKRQGAFIFNVGILVLIGKFVDWYLIIMPNSAKATSGFGPMEIGFFLFFGGLFGLSLVTALSKANLIPKNHPFTEESLHHEI